MAQIQTLETEQLVNQTSAAVAEEEAGREVAQSAGSGIVIVRGYTGLAIIITQTVAIDIFMATTGTPSASDVDAGATMAYGLTGGLLVGGVLTKAGSYGTLAVTAASGDYTFTPNAAAINALSASTTETYVVTVSDGTATTMNLVINLTGVNDPPVVVVPIADFTVNKDAANVVTNLTTTFADIESSAVSLTYAVVGNTNAALVTATITQGTNLPLAFAADGYGTSQVSVSATDPGGLSVTNSFVVRLNSVNDAPSFALPAGGYGGQIYTSVGFSSSYVLTVLEDAAAQSQSGFATSISAGPADEAAQTVAFTPTNDNNALFSAQPVIAADGTLTFTPAANANGSATVMVTAQDNGLTANGGVDTSAAQTFTITFTPVADLSVIKTGPPVVTNGVTFSYSITVTNHGPSGAINVVVTDLLPTNLTYSGSSPAGVFASNTVTWPTIPSLPVGGVTNFTITVVAPASGTFTNVASAVADTLDTDSSNNSGVSASSQATTTAVSPAQFRLLQRPNVFNPQTGLFEQRVTVTNIGGTTAAALRLLVGDIRSTNGTPRTNVFLWNATGTDFDQRRFVDYNSPLDPGSNVTIILEFYNPLRTPFTNSIEVQLTLPAPSTINSGTGLAITRIFVDSRLPGDPRPVIEFPTLPGCRYTIIYTDDLVTWRTATPSVTASANSTQWYDDGPPKTISKPVTRTYRVIANP